MCVGVLNRGSFAFRGMAGWGGGRGWGRAGHVSRDGCSPQRKFGPGGKKGIPAKSRTLTDCMVDIYIYDGTALEAPLEYCYLSNHATPVRLKFNSNRFPCIYITSDRTPRTPRPPCPPAFSKFFQHHTSKWIFIRR